MNVEGRLAHRNVKPRKACCLFLCKFGCLEKSLLSQTPESLCVGMCTRTCVPIYSEEAMQCVLPTHIFIIYPHVHMEINFFYAFSNQVLIFSLLIWHVSVYCPHVCCASCICLVPLRPEVCFGIPWNWRDRLSWVMIWVLGTKPQSSGRAANGLNHWASHQP